MVSTEKFQVVWTFTKKLFCSSVLGSMLMSEEICDEKESQTHF